jgi:hypothetical protein
LAASVGDNPTYFVAASSTGCTIAPVIGVSPYTARVVERITSAEIPAYFGGGRTVGSTEPWAYDEKKMVCGNIDCVSGRGGPANP